MDFGFWTCALLGTIVLIGCDTPESGGSEAHRPPQPLKTGTAAIRGTVKFTGTPPVMAKIANQPCHQDAGPIEEESAVVNKDGTLKNVCVFLEGAGRGDGASRPPVLLDQVNCRYVPHAIGVQIGQPLAIRSSDPTIHNVHYAAERNKARNFGMTGAGQEKQVTFAEPEFILVKCDVHPWMNAWIGVFENPYFAVTGDDGAFELVGLPAGTYNLVAWHERFGRREQSVTLRDGAETAADFEYKSPAGR